MAAKVAMLFWASISCLVGAPAQAGRTTETGEAPAPTPILCALPDLAASDPRLAQAEKHCLDTVGPNVARKGSVLTIHLDGDKVSRFANNDEDCDVKVCARYQFEGFIPKYKVYLVRTLLGDTVDETMVTQDGESYVVAAPIHLSPSGDIAVSVADSNEATPRDYDIKIMDLSLLKERTGTSGPLGSMVSFQYRNGQAWRFDTFVDDETIEVSTAEAQVPSALFRAMIRKDRFGFWQLERRAPEQVPAGPR